MGQIRMARILSHGWILRNVELEDWEGFRKRVGGRSLEQRSSVRGSNASRTMISGADPKKLLTPPLTLMNGPTKPHLSQPMSAEPSCDGSWVRAAVDRYQGPLTLYAARLLGDADAARDVVQDTFLRLCAQDRGVIEARLAEWLFTVCRNRALDVLRKESRMSHLSEEQVHRCLSTDPSPPDLAERRELAGRVLGLLDSLPLNQREVIRLKFQNGFSYQEISRISGHSVSNVGYLIHAGMKTLRGLLFDGQPIEVRS